MEAHQVVQFWRVGGFDLMVLRWVLSRAYVHIDFGLFIPICRRTVSWTDVPVVQIISIRVREPPLE
jgi:hypothetical protein